MILDSLNNLSFRLRLLLVFAAGAAMALSMPPTGWWPLLFAGLSVLYFFLTTTSGWRSFLTGWVFGFGYFAAGLYWIGNALLVPGNDFIWAWPLAVLGLPVALAFFTGAGCWFATRMADLKTRRGFAAFILALISTEWLRGHIFTGFPWNLYGYGWAEILPLVQSVSLFGVYGLTMLTIAVCALPGFLAASRPKQKNAAFSLLLAALALTALYGWGWNRLQDNPVKSSADLTIRIVQPNIPQEDKWNSALLVQNLQKIVAQSLQNFAENTNYAMIWPETAITDYVVNDPNAADYIRSSLFPPGRTGYLISGVLLHENGDGGEPRYRNSLVVYDALLKPLAAYHKSHLVPFGEYIPLQNYIPLSPVVRFSGFTPGEGVKTETVAGLPPFSALVCYEVLFPGKAASKTLRPEWIINVTNDSWYGDSPGPYQHLTKAVYRAVEEGLPVIRSANTGISAYTDAYGRILGKVKYNKEGYIDVPLTEPAPPTLYGTYKDLYLFGFGLILAMSVFVGRKN